MEKRGQGMSISTVILLILGLVVLVVLIIGFSVGWSKIFPFLSNSNVDAISTQCSTACTTNSQYGFCSQTRELNDGKNTYKNVTCYYLSQPQQSAFGIAACPSVTCSNIVFNYTASTLADLQASCGSNAGKTVEAMIGGSLQSIPCASA